MLIFSGLFMDFIGNFPKVRVSLDVGDCFPENKESQLDSRMQGSQL